MNPFKSMIRIRYSQSALMLGLLLSSLITWVPPVYHSFILFFSVSLPNIISVAVLAPKWPFIVSNLIVIFLYGESKIGKCTMEDEDNCICMTRKLMSDENLKETIVENIQENKEEEVLAVAEEINSSEIVARREENGAQGNEEQAEKECQEMEMREDEIKMESMDEELERRKEELEREEEQMEIVEYADQMESEHEQLDRDVREREEMEVWPAEEFNRKVEDFIAKMNMQLRLEARMAISCY